MEGRGHVSSLLGSAKVLSRSHPLARALEDFFWGGKVGWLGHRAREGSWKVFYCRLRVLTDELG